MLFFANLRKIALILSAFNRLYAFNAFYPCLFSKLHHLFCHRFR